MAGTRWGPWNQRLWPGVKPSGSPSRKRRVASRTMGRQRMWRLAVALGVLVLAGCGPLQGHEVAGGQVSPISGDPAQAVASALAFAADSDPEAAVVDGYATLSRRVKPGEEPTDLVAGHARPCARRPSEPFTQAERAAIRAAFHGRTVGFVADPAAALHARGPGAVLLVATRPLLDAQHGTVLVIRCVPGPRPMPVDVRWDGRAWRAVAIAGRGG
jgi:hypothetical protein